MRYLNILYGIVLSIFFLACSNDKEIEDFENDLETNAIELSSPEGFEIAESNKDLQELVGKAEGIAPANVGIEWVEFVDTEKVSIAYVNYKNVETEESSNIVIANGAFKYDAGHLQVNNINSSNKSADGDVTISCGGCANCRVQGRRDGDTGDYHFSCESECCTMTIREDDGGGGTN